MTSGGVARGHQVSAVASRAWAQVDQLVGREHRVAVVLDDDDGVAQIPQAHQGREQPVVVAMVQTDRGLVENVEDADELATDLRREADPLRLPAGQASPTRDRA